MTPRLLRPTRAAVLLAAAALPLVAAAHVGDDAAFHHGAIPALIAGFLHPLTGLDHLAALLAVGAWSALVGRARTTPAIFVATMAAGAAAGALLADRLPGVVGAGVEPAIAASLLILGLLLATRAALGTAGTVVAAAFAAAHGLAHGQELAGPSAAAAILGMVWSSALIVATGAALGWAARRRHVWLTRGAGLATIAFGLVLAGPALAALVP